MASGNRTDSHIAASQRVRRLWLIRHAKSDWNAPGLSDFDRPLNGRGRRDGPRMAAWLATQPWPARWIWTSAAVRAQQTAAFVEAGFAAAIASAGADACNATTAATGRSSIPAPELIVEPRLYLAAPDTLLQVLRETPDDVDAAGLVAHNPGLTELVNELAGGPILDNLPTFGVAAFDCSGDWSTLRPATVHLTGIMSPKRLPAGDDPPLT